MYDQSFSQDTLLRTLRKSDFLKSPFLYIEKEKIKFIDKITKTVNSSSLGKIDFKTHKTRGGYVYMFSSFEHELIFRKVNKNILNEIRIKQGNRTEIVQRIIKILQEGVKYNIYRLDIKKFYESIHKKSFIKSLESNLNLSNISKSCIKELLENYAPTNDFGIPRGIAVSSTLSELYMRDFDIKIKNLNNVFFYCRYVDDIIIITSTEEGHSRTDMETFQSEIEKMLPTGLKWNNKKCRREPIKKYHLKMILRQLIISGNLIIWVINLVYVIHL